MSEPEVMFERFSFSVRLKSLFFPVSVIELVPLLEQLGYKLRPEVLQVVRDIAIGTRVAVGGAIADNEVANQVRIETERGVLAISGREVASVVSDFDRLQGLISDRLHVDLQSEANHYEITADGTAFTGEDPTKVISNIYAGSPFEKVLARIFGFEVTNFGLRIVQKNRYVTDAEWFDYRLEPLVAKPRSTYHVNIVYRHPDKESVQREAQVAQSKLKALLVAMEHNAQDA